RQRQPDRARYPQRGARKEAGPRPARARAAAAAAVTLYWQQNTNSERPSMTVYDFDTLIPRRGSDSAKWNAFDADVLPLWVADMDFRSPEPVLRALHERVEQGIFGYAFGSEKPLAQTISD